MGGCWNCPAAVVHLVHPKPAWELPPKLVAPSVTMRTHGDCPSPRENLEGGGTIQREKAALGYVGISMGYAETLQNSCINKALNADVVAGHARDCVREFVSRDHVLWLPVGG